MHHLIINDLLLNRRYSVKLISETRILEKALIEYNSLWTIDYITNKKEPLLMITSGMMKQIAADATFLGDAVEEKFHMHVFSITVVPCIPLISNRLKNMVHPQIVPTELQDGPVEGFFLVNLSINNQENVDENYTFYPTEDYAQQYNENEGNNNSLIIKKTMGIKKTIIVDLNSDAELEESEHENDEELEDHPAPASSRGQRRPTERNEEEEYETGEFNLLSTVRRFSDDEDSEDEHATNSMSIFVYKPHFFYLTQL